MLKQAVLLLDRAKPDAGQSPLSAEWLTLLLENIARQGIREFLLIDRGGRLQEAAIAPKNSRSVPDDREPGSPSSPRYTVDLPQIQARGGDASALAELAPRLDERFLLVDAGCFLDINYLDLLTLGRDTLMNLALHGDVEANAWGSVALLRRDALAGVDPQGGIRLAEDLVPGLAAAGQVAGRCYQRPLVRTDAPDAVARVRRLMHRSAVFFDRDGVLNVDRAYVSRIDQFEWIDGAREAVKLFNDAGWYVFVVTNQSGIARGLYPESDVATLHAHMAAELRKAGAFIDRIEYCPYHEDGTIPAYRRASSRRKPGPGMLLACFEALPVDRKRSFLVGDKSTDIAAAEAAGIAGHLFQGGNLLDVVRPLLTEATAQ